MNDYGPDPIDQREEWLKEKSTREAKVILEILKIEPSPEKAWIFLANILWEHHHKQETLSQIIFEYEELAYNKNKKRHREKIERVLLPSPVSSAKGRAEWKRAFDAVEREQKQKIAAKKLRKMRKVGSVLRQLGSLDTC